MLWLNDAQGDKAAAPGGGEGYPVAVQSQFSAVWGRYVVVSVVAFGYGIAVSAVRSESRWASRGADGRSCAAEGRILVAMSSCSRVLSEGVGSSFVREQQ
jgi:hypothetical protein